MNKLSYKVVITTSGTGSRLGEITKRTNKALVPLAGQPAIEYILGSYAKDVPVVVTIGYLAEQVQDYLTEHHPDRSFEFVTIDPFEGAGSSLGYSLAQAAPYLQCPFIFHACDTIVVEDVLRPDRNWAASYWAAVGTDLSPYRTHQIENRTANNIKQPNKLLGIYEKGEVDFAPVHIGLTGVKDFGLFWQTLQALQASRSADDTLLSDVHVIDAMVKNGTPFASIPFQIWLDTGNPAALARASTWLETYG